MALIGSEMNSHAASKGVILCSGRRDKNVLDFFESTFFIQVGKTQPIRCQWARLWWCQESMDFEKEVFNLHGSSLGRIAKGDEVEDIGTHKTGHGKEEGHELGAACDLVQDEIEVGGHPTKKGGA